MRSIIKYLQLPFQFSEDQLVAELHALDATWTAHFNTADYTGSWSAIPLRSVKGSLSNIFPDADVIDFEDTILMQQCPYIKSVVETLPCPKTSVRLMKLDAGAEIKEHRDRELSFEHGAGRIHIPITTNADVEFYLGGDRLTLLPATCWYMNFNLPHRIANRGATHRTHLVIDIVVSDELRQLFAEGNPTTTLAEEDPLQSPEQKKLIIENLLALNTPISLSLAQKMMEEIER
jgi:hypothetical protein